MFLSQRTFNYIMIAEFYETSKRNNVSKEIVNDIIHSQLCLLITVGFIFHIQFGMAAQDLDKLYEELLAEYNSSKESLKQVENRRKELDRIIAQYRQQLESSSQHGEMIPTPNHQHPQAVLKLKETFEEEQKCRLKKRQEKSEQIDKLKREISNASQSTAAKKEQLKKQLEAAKTSRQNLQVLSSQIEETASRQQKDKLRLQAELSAFKGGENEQKDQQIDLLSAELKKLQVEVAEADSALKEAEFERETKLDLPEVEQKQKEIKDIIQDQAKLKDIIASLENQLKHFGTNKDNQIPYHDKETFEVIQRQSEELAQKIEQAETNMANEKKNAKDDSKKKQTASKTLRSDIFQAEKERQMLKLTIERDSHRLNDLMELKKTYVSAEILTVLNKEYQKLKKEKRPFLVTEGARSKKLIAENKSLRNKIGQLEAASKKMVIDKGTELTSCEVKFNDLVTEKKNIDKNLLQLNNQLTDLMRQFPEHQKIKEQKRLQAKRQIQEKKRKQEEDLLLLSSVNKTHRSISDVTIPKSIITSQIYVSTVEKGDSDSEKETVKKTKKKGNKGNKAKKDKNRSYDDAKEIPSEIKLENKKSFIERHQVPLAALAAVVVGATAIMTQI